jgi:hypothetical protein
MTAGISHNIVRRQLVAAALIGVAALAGLGPGLGSARAGGQMTFGDDTNTSANDGPPFFGFVRDADGAAVADARVTATVKTGGAVVTTSNSIGIYKIAGFAKSIHPDDVAISCAKDGYKQANVLRRDNAAGDTADPIEVDCTLQKE